MESKPIQRILNIDAPDYRMRDIELVVRYFAFKFYITDYTGNLKLFFDEAVNKLNLHWPQQERMIVKQAELLNQAISLCIDIFDGKPFRKWKNGAFDKRFNRAIFDIMVYYFSNETIFDIVKNQKESIKEAFIELCANDIDFLSSFEFSTKNITPTQYRFRVWGDKIASIFSIPVSIPEIRNER